MRASRLRRIITGIGTVSRYLSSLRQMTPGLGMRTNIHASISQPVNRTAQLIGCWVPFALRAPAAAYLLEIAQMAHPEDSARQSSQMPWSRTRLAKAGAAYCVLAGLGIGVLLEFVPNLFDFGELSAVRFLVLVALLLFVVAPVIAVGYIVFSALVEALVVGMGRLFQACLRALARFFKRIFHNSGE